jgi:hypothetical protein
MNRPAPINNTSDRATCATTSKLRNENHYRLPLVSGSSFSAGTTSVLVAAQTGARPKITIVNIDSRIVKPSARQSRRKSTFKLFGFGSSDRNRRSRRIASPVRASGSLMKSLKCRADGVLANHREVQCLLKIGILAKDRRSAARILIALYHAIVSLDGESDGERGTCWVGVNQLDRPAMRFGDPERDW